MGSYHKFTDKPRAGAGKKAWEYFEQQGIKMDTLVYDAHYYYAWLNGEKVGSAWSFDIRCSDISHPRPGGEG